MLRTIPLLVIVGLITAACGDQPLNDAGDATRGWLDGGTTTSTAAAVATTTSTVARGPAVRSADELTWYTANTGDLPDDPDAVAAQVWERTNRVDEFVQASADEIAAALPEIGFPGVVHDEIAHVTSQLIFSTETGRLARDFQAAFGLWSIEPYSRDRSVAQYAVLRVARDSAGATASIDDPGGGCGQFAERVPDACRAHAVEGGAAWLLTDRAGATLIWFESGYRYELFHRSMVTTDDALAMAEAMVGLTESLPG